MKKVFGNCFSRINGNVYKKWDMSTSSPALSTTLCLSDSTVAVKEDYPDGTAVRSQDNVTCRVNEHDPTGEPHQRAGEILP